MNTDTQLLTVDEAAAVLAVHPVTVRRRIASGELPAIRLGDNPHSAIRIDPQELREWLKSDPRS